MLIALLGTTYLVLAIAIVLVADRVAGFMFKIPEEVGAPRGIRLVRLGLLRRLGASKI